MVVVGETMALPLVASPVEKPVPVHTVASVLLQVSWLLPPSGINAKSAPSVAVTAGPTVTVAPAGALVAPPAPSHTTEYAVVLAGETGTVPLASPPVSKPVPVQPVASVLLQVRSLDPPSAMVSGAAPSVAVMAGPIVTVALSAAWPPGPVHVIVYVVVVTGVTF